MMKKVFTALHEDDVAKVQSMRKEGFKNYLCKNCSDGGSKDLCNQSAQLSVITPPKAVHIPQLGFEFSNSSGEKTLQYYNAPSSVKSGVIITACHVGGLFLLSGVLVGDLLYGVGDYCVDNWGEVWDGVLNVSLKLVDVFHRSVLGGDVVLRVCGVDGVLRECKVSWGSLDLGREIRLLDRVHDAGLHNEVVKWRGVTFKSLRLEDVYRFGLREYMSLKNQHEYRVLVCDLDANSSAYHTKSLRPGDVLEVFEEYDKPTSWEHFLEQLGAIPEDHPAKLKTESNTVIIL